MNRLRHETSPYLLQHANNPVHWCAWKPEAFEKARAENKPILVSIGYSTCHWCHVMERERFGDEEVAAFMNEHFVNIKVDREELPDGISSFHTYKEGQAQHDAFPDDYALLIEALIEVCQINHDTALLRQAKDLCAYLMGHFLDSGHNLFYFTGQSQEDIPLRRRELYDSATPSGNSTMAHNLHKLGLLLGKPVFSQLAVDMLSGVKTSVEQYPNSFARWANALLYQSYPCYEIALVGQQAAAKAIHLQQSFIPNAVVMASATASEDWPLLAGRGTGGDTNIYVCQEYACKRPVDTVAAALELLNSNG